MLIWLTLLFTENLQAQDSLYTHKKTYNSFKAPLIEDNSFFVEEAFNQQKGVVQFISTCYFTKIRQGDMAYSFTHEIPLKGVKHQFSYTLNYSVFPSLLPNGHGLGDVMVNYRYELAGKNNWALITPRLSLIMPTGDVNKGLGSGAWGTQVNLPVSKMISNKLVTHYNAGFTYLKDAHHSLADTPTQDDFIQQDLTHFHTGASIIWMVSNRLNGMLEYMSSFNDQFDAVGKVSKHHEMLVNPGIRYAFQAGKSQIVPGISLPIARQEGQSTTGLFFYLSIEPDFNLEGN
jgi:hypothetical protein